MGRSAIGTVLLAVSLWGYWGITPAGAQTPSPAAVPIYNAATGRCEPPPRVGLERLWHVSPTGDASSPAPGQTVRLRLYTPQQAGVGRQALTIRVLAPGGAATTARVVPDADGWTEAIYPTQFPGAPALALGTYTVLWETAGGFMTCGGFVVRDTGGA
jgi:hypothetical protein